jgi:type II secretory pathway pseudopilin PulG
MHTKRRTLPSARHKQQTQQQTMKTNNQIINRRKAGMTLLELTVVILVLLSLISILFVGARAWKQGSDRSANIMNIRNVQQAVRGHQNMNNMRNGENLADTVIFDTTNGYLKRPTPPHRTGVYTFGTVIPAPGVLYTGPNTDHSGTYGFKSNADYQDW